MQNILEVASIYLTIDIIDYRVAILWNPIEHSRSVAHQLCWHFLKGEFPHFPGHLASLWLEFSNSRIFQLYYFATSMHARLIMWAILVQFAGHLASQIHANKLQSVPLFTVLFQSRNLRRYIVPQLSHKHNHVIKTKTKNTRYVSEIQTKTTHNHSIYVRRVYAQILSMTSSKIAIHESLDP